MRIGLAGEGAKVWQKLGVNAITDELLEAQITHQDATLTGIVVSKQYWKLVTKRRTSRSRSKL